MALTLDVRSPRKIELADYLEFLRTDVDPACVESVIASATMLQGLSQNRTVLLEMLHRNLLGAVNSPDSLFYTAHSFILGSANGMTVRGNIWPTVEQFATIEHRRGHVNKVYAYEYPHDHNFNFLTAGWFGPGYTTDIYEYDYELVNGFDGEECALTFLERTSLSEGKVMFYREGRDVHVQHPPMQISASLNLLVRTPLTKLREQYVFEIGANRIARIAPGSDVARTELMANFAAVIGDASSCDVLRQVAERSSNGRVRAAALRALVSVDPAASIEVDVIAESDPSPHVKRLSQAA